MCVKMEGGNERLIEQSQPIGFLILPPLFSFMCHDHKFRTLEGVARELTDIFGDISNRRFLTSLPSPHKDQGRTGGRLCLSVQMMLTTTTLNPYLLNTPFNELHESIFFAIHGFFLTKKPSKFLLDC